MKIPFSNTKKLLPRFIGPFKITAKIGPVAYRLELPEEYQIHNVFHVSLLKKYHASADAAQPPPPDWIDGDWEFELECILAHREKKVAHHKPKKEYLVKWKGYGLERFSWEPESSLMEHAQEVVQDYWASRALNEVVETRKRTKHASVAGSDSKRGGRKDNASKKRRT